MPVPVRVTSQGVPSGSLRAPLSLMPSQSVTFRVLWVCDDCGACGEAEAELPAACLEDLTLEEVAAATLAAVRAVSHPHPIRPGVSGLGARQFY